MPYHAGPCREAPGSFRRQKELGESKARARAFTVVFAGRKGQGSVGRLSKLRIGQFEGLQFALGYRDGPLLSSTWPWGDSGQEDNVLGCRSLEEESG